jgi:hypothetical protein
MIEFLGLFGLEGSIGPALQLLLGAFALGTLVMLVIQGLKKAGVIPDGSAGQWSAWLNTGLIAIGMIIKALGGEAGGVTEWATALAGGIVAAAVAIASAKGMYEGGKRAGVIGERPAAG